MVKSRETDQQREEVRAGEFAASDGHHVLRSRELYTLTTKVYWVMEEARCGGHTFAMLKSTTPRRSA